MLDRQKRDAINAYRPVKRQYVHQYRQECIKRRQLLEKNQEDLEMLKKLFGFTMMKVHTRARKAESDESLAGIKKSTSTPPLRRSSSMDSLYTDGKSTSTLMNNGRTNRTLPILLLSPLSESLKARDSSSAQDCKQ